MQDNIVNPQHKLTIEQQHNRSNVVIVSEEGLNFRKELIDERRQSDFMTTKNRSGVSLRDNILPISENISQVSLSKLNSMAHLSLIKSTKSQQRLISELKADMPQQLDSLPYIKQSLHRSVNWMVNGRTKHQQSVTQMNAKMIALHASLNDVNKLISKRSLNNIPKQMTSSIIEEDELQDRIAAIANIESRIERMEARYKRGKQLQSQVEKKIQREYKNQKEQEGKYFAEPPPQTIFDDRFDHLYKRETLYKERLKERLVEYQNHKFEWNWKVQAPPKYVSKAEIQEMERQRQLKRQQEIDEYNKALSNLNSPPPIKLKTNFSPSGSPRTTYGPKI